MCWESALLTRTFRRKTQPTLEPIWLFFSTVQGCATVPHLRVREIVTRDGLIPVAQPFSFPFCFFLLFFFSFFFWPPDRTALSHHHHPYPLPPSVSHLYHPIWFCIEEICWRLWVARAPNGLSLFCQHALAFLVGVETFSDCGC